MEEFKTLLFGNHSIAYHIVAFLFMLIGTLITILYDAQTRSKNGNRTPKNWNWKFYFYDNAFRLFLNVLMAIMVIRFFQDITGIPLSMFYCFLIGIGIDGMYIVFKKLRKKIKNQLNENH